MRMSLLNRRARHEGKVLFGEEAQQLMHERSWRDNHPEGSRATVVAWCRCGWWAPCLHGEQAEQMVQEHLATP